MNKSLSASVGFMIAIMLVFNGTLSSHIGNYQSTFIIHLSGLLIVILYLLIKKEKLDLNPNLSIYLYSGGIIGVFPVLFNNIGFAYLGVSLTLALVLLGQSLTSLVFDHYQILKTPYNPYKKKKSWGLFLIILGIILMAFE